ncbi:DUF294 nucleotidyltransferase-like domain-containing protein [Paenibacillus hamazuiensis]|uniref:DUF294 nucleotidyltransferase-like domain-containing protein n=1 Tax=Paenibacillus hamazuiensis TaxID=2936508 RepID=UPI00200CE200|nr:DUF294 nucleotidyltransferase-like domain-containing protein [Paenibacillus hamazuiensis]
MERLSMERMLERIFQAERFEELREIRDRIHEDFHKDLLFPHSLDENKRLNEIHDAMISRIVHISEQEMNEQGKGEPPVPYSFILYGSGGRKEQTLWSDQDNGILFDDPEERDVEQVSSYFKELVDCIEWGMAIVGYPPCSGDVICANPQWRKPLSAYRSMLREWLVEPNWEHVRYLLIMADMRCVYGSEMLAEKLKDDFYEYVEEHRELLYHMLQNTLHHKISLGVFGQLIKERYGEDAGGVDIKYGAYIPIVNGVRLLAVEAGIRCTSTQERIERLIADNHVEEELGHDWLEALSLVMKLRAETPFQIQDGQYTTRGKLPADMLTKERTNQLKFCLRIGKDLQKYVQNKVKLQKG